LHEENIYRPLLEKFFEKDIPAAVHILEGMSEDAASEVLQLLPPELGMRAIRRLQISYVADLFERFQDSYLREICPLLGPQFAASLVMHLSANSRERITEYLSKAVKDQISELFEYPEGSVGRIMVPEFITFYRQITAEEAIDSIRSLAKKRFPATNAYVVDEEDRLIGILNMQELMFASPEQRVESICSREVFALHCFTDNTDAAQELAKRNVFAVPVVNSENQVMGIIKAEQMLHGVQEEVSEDLQRIFGAGANERVFSDISFSLKKRLPWLHVNLASAFLAAGVVSLFEDIIAQLTILAVFLPVVAGQGGNSGAQSLAVVMRGIVMREIPKDKLLALISKEGKLGAINGLVIGVVTAGVAYLWNGNPFLGLVVGLGMLVNLICAGLAGASIPLLLKRFGLDPAQSSSIFLTTVTDVVGFFAFLGFAVIFQGFLS